MMHSMAYLATGSTDADVEAANTRINSRETASGRRNFFKLMTGPILLAHKTRPTSQGRLEASHALTEFGCRRHSGSESLGTRTAAVPADGVREVSENFESRRSKGDLCYNG